MNNVLSLFDGASIAQLVLQNLGIKVDNYYASEIDKAAMTVTKHHFPNTIFLGDVRYIDGTKLKHITFICGGSPCTDFSFMGHQRGMVTQENHIIDTLEKYLKLKSEGFVFKGSSYLFWEYVRLFKETNAKYFFLENVRMSKKWKQIITDALGVEPIFINSSRVSGQNRERNYWTNIPKVSIPEDKGIHISDVIPGAEAGAGRRGVPDKSKGLKPDGRPYYRMNYTCRPDGKANCVVTSVSATGMYLKNGEYVELTPEECELLQTFKPGYTKVKGVSKTNRYKIIGNSWTVEVIQHLFKGLTTIKRFTLNQH